MRSSSQLRSSSLIPPLAIVSRHYLPITLAAFLVAAVSATADDLRGHHPPLVSLLREFRPIGGVRNNLQNPRLNAVPGAPETALAPMNYIPGSVLPGTTARTISNMISGGTGAHGENSETEDPVAS